MWGNLGWTGFENGGFHSPYNTLSEGVAAAPVGGVVGLYGPASSVEAPIINKHVVIRPFAGPSTIGQ